MAAAQSRVTDKERLNYDSDHVTAQRESEGSNDHWKEAAQAARQKADAERRAESCQAAQQEAEQSLRMAQLEVARLKVCSGLCVVASCMRLHCSSTAMHTISANNFIVCYSTKKSECKLYVRVLGDLVFCCWSAPHAWR